LSIDLHSAANETYSSNSLIIKFKINSVLLEEARFYTPKDYTGRLSIHDAGLRNSLELKSFMNEHQISEIYAANPEADLNQLPGGIERIFILTLFGPGKVEVLINKLSKHSAVEYAELDYLGTGGGRISSAIVPNDPSFNNQWGLRNTGQTIGGIAGTPGGDINAINAWDITTGVSNIRIAVLDSGVPLGHPEFAGRLIQGYDFANNDDNPTDDHGHGTNVTSIIGAKGNNNSLMAGVNWNSMIIPIKILDQNNSGQYSWWVSGITFAVNNGAKVLNMSVGGGSYSQSLADAVTFAASNNRIVIVCMMNNNNNQVYYPAGFSNVIAIGATNNRNRRAVPFCWGGGSSFGPHIDFCAPGEMILGLIHNNMNSTNYWCGTSQATPNTAGVVSLMVSIDSSLTYNEIYDALKTSARDQVGPANEDTPGFDNYFGWGLINARGALDLVIGITPISTEVPDGYKLQQNYPNPFNPVTKIRFGIPAGSKAALLEIYDVIGRKVATLVNEQLTAGTYEVNFDASAYSSGVYYYKLVSGDFSEVKKMVLVK